MTTLTANAQQDPKTLQPCPNSPNCVSSQGDNAHFIAPFKIKGDADAAFVTLKQMLAARTRTKVTASDADTLHAEATSLVFRFVDDVDALLDKAAGVIHIRSASRTGYGDFGVNRQRVEALRASMQQAGAIE